LDNNKSEEYYQRALKVMPGGVSSPVRAFLSVSGRPIFFSKGIGSRIVDVDSNSFIDYCCSWGALILGHAYPAVTKAVTEAITNGTSFGAPCESELLLAEKICATVKNVEKVRFVNSGTEATMSAVRLARAFTSRKKIVKFEGCYHGHSDTFLTLAGSGMATMGIPASPGVPEEVVANTITLPYNDVDAVKNEFDKHGKDIAAIIVEPIAGNMGVIPPVEGFLETLRELCDKFDAILIFDEVITGFRVDLGGAQSLYGVDADIVCLGKIIGGGFPVGAYGGSKDIMKFVAPEGPVYQAGTLAGNPVAMSAGLATLNLLNDSTYQHLESLSSALQGKMIDVAESMNINIIVNRVGSMLSLFFADSPITNYKDVKNSNLKLFPVLHSIMLRKKIYLPPSPMESLFISSSHSYKDVESTVDAFYDFCEGLEHERIS